MLPLTAYTPNGIYNIVIDKPHEYTSICGKNIFDKFFPSKHNFPHSSQRERGDYRGERVSLLDLFMAIDRISGSPRFFKFCHYYLSPTLLIMLNMKFFFPKLLHT